MTKPSNELLASLDPNKFQAVQQIGGIRTGSLDYPDAGGGHGSRVAFFNTGSGLRFTVALDRGGDPVEASFNHHNLAFLTPNGYKPANHAYHLTLEGWLQGWPGGLVTTCGPISIGRPNGAIPNQPGLHGHFSNTPAAIESISNPDPARGKFDMSLTMLINDTSMFDPVYEIRRTIKCTLGDSALHIHDEVTNRGNTSPTHHYLYHCNFGYPLLDQGGRIVVKGRASKFWSEEGISKKTAEQYNALKQIPGPMDAHTGANERGMLLHPEADAAGLCNVALVNDDLQLAVQLTYPEAQMPALANWQHFGPGCYVTGLEPHHGALITKDPEEYRRFTIDPGETREYDLTLKVLTGAEQIKTLDQHDGELTA